MADTTRELIAYGLIGLIIFAAAPWLVVAQVSRRRERLRWRGVKRHGH